MINTQDLSNSFEHIYTVNGYIILVNLGDFYNRGWACPRNCGRMYSTKNSLASHLHHDCGRLPQFLCKNCTRTFKRKYDLKKHTLSCVNVPPEFGCPLCNKFFRQKVNLKKHMMCVHKVVT